jgi:hypothetical protein
LHSSPAEARGCQRIKTRSRPVFGLVVGLLMLLGQLVKALTGAAGGFGAPTRLCSRVAFRWRTTGLISLIRGSRMHHELRIFHGALIERWSPAG